MENTVDSETKILFKESSVWMKVYSIILLVLFSLIFIFLLFAISNLEEIYKAMGGQGINEKVIGKMRAVFLFLLIIVSLFGYAIICLLKAGNGFNQLSDVFIGQEVTAAFRNFRLFWTISGISLVILLIYFIYAFLGGNM